MDQGGKERGAPSKKKRKKEKEKKCGGEWVFSEQYVEDITYLAPLTRARAPVSGLPLCLYISLHQNSTQIIHLVWYLWCNVLL